MKSTSTVLLIALSACYRGGATPAPTMQPLTIVLRVQPASVTMATRSILEVGFVVTNATNDVLDPQLDAANLYVNDVASIEFANTIGNGAHEAGDTWHTLPPGQLIERAWSDMGEALFDEPGAYTLVLEAHGVRSAPVAVQVTP